MHVSLPDDLEKMVKDRVASGVYDSVSEVVRAALHKFFHLPEKDSMDHKEAAYIRETVGPRLAALDNGNAELADFDDAFDEIERKHFK